MGWRGTVRTLVAAQRRYEREERTRQRELQRQAAQQEKTDERIRAAAEVAAFESLIETICSMHKEVGPHWDWKRLHEAKPPAAPASTESHTRKARQEFAGYQPSFFDRVLSRTERKRAAFRSSILSAQRKDAEEYKVATAAHAKELAAWQDSRDLAQRILDGDIEAMREAVEEAKPFEELSDLGSRIDLRLSSDGTAEVQFLVNGSHVIPKDTMALLKTGRISVKKMPPSRFHELYQDYVCGAVLRIARELFALLPLKLFVVTALGEVLNSATGHIEQRPILSVAIPNDTFIRLNFDTLDPSDALRNFVHNMSFAKTKGFAPVDGLTIDSFSQGAAASGQCAA